MGETAKVFVIDDEENILTMVSMALQKEGCAVVCYGDPAAAVREMDQDVPDVIVTDIKMPGISGIEVLKKAKKVNPQVNVILMTAYASVETAIEAIRGGAYDYLVKPFKINDLRAVVKRALSTKRYPATAAHGPVAMVGASKSLGALKKMISRVAKKDTTVLIEGESGTGKELVARSIHVQSARAAAPFVSINCAALPETLLASELFGYEKGAFTGAAAQKIGLFEFANGGTLLLDEVGEMSEAMQLKLLRVLQEREIKRVGGVDAIPVNVRVLSATNKVLRDEVEAGQFREDLFYRLNVVPLHIPPLRERPDDVEALIAHFIEMQNQKHGECRVFKFSDDVRALLRGYGWKGNVRELEHVVERLYVMSDETCITRAVVDEVFGKKFFNVRSRKTSGSSGSLKEDRAQFEKEKIVQALEETGGNKYQAAKKLNMTRQSLQYKLKKYGLV